MRLRLPSFRKTAESIRLTAQMGVMLWPFARRQRALGTALASVTLLMVAARLALPWPLKAIFDHLSGRESEIPWLPVEGPGAMAIFSAAFLALALAAGLAEYGLNVLVGLFANRTVYGFRMDLFRHVMTLPLTFHDRREVGELMTRVVHDTQRLRRGVSGIVLRACKSVLLFGVTLIVLFWLDPFLAAIALASGLFAGVAMLFRGGAVFREATRTRKREGQLASVVTDNLQSVREQQTYRPEGAPDRRFQRHNDRSLRGEVVIRRLQAGLLFMVAILGDGPRCCLLDIRPP